MSDRVTGGQREPGAGRAPSARAPPTPRADYPEGSVLTQGHRPGQLYVPMVGEGAPSPRWLREVTSEAPSPGALLALAGKATHPAGTAPHREGCHG